MNVTTGQSRITQLFPCTTIAAKALDLVAETAEIGFRHKHGGLNVSQPTNVVRLVVVSCV